MSDEFQDAVNWLASVEVHSEAEASNKELILSKMEEIAKMIEEKIPTTISFEIKEPRRIMDSNVNTLILLINEINYYLDLTFIEKEQEGMYNNLIEQAKKVLDSLKIIDL